MKKPVMILICTTCAFLLILTGIFIGRNVNRGIIPVESLTDSKPQTETQSEEPDTTPSTQSGVININDATAEQLQLLPGIGETLSERIISYREENGLFQSIDQIMNVNGIGEEKFKLIQDYITIGG